MREKDYTAKQVCEALFAAKGVVTDAAENLGCDPRTIYNYRKEFEDVAQALILSRQGLVDEAKGYLVRMMRNPKHRDHYKAIIKILTTYDRETDWSDRQQITGADRGALMLRWSDEEDDE